VAGLAAAGIAGADRAAGAEAGMAAAEAEVAAPGSGAARAGTEARRIALHNVHTGERLDLEYFRDGVYLPESLTAIQVLLRDFRNDQQHVIDPALMDYLHEVSRQLRADPVFDVISGYRSPQTNALLHERSSGVAVKSLHLQGRAIDVRLAGVDCADLAGRAREMTRGGVGYYRHSDFVHLDTGPFRTWNG